MRYIYKMKNTALKVLLFVITFQLFSCSKDWLKPEPLSFFTPENTFIDAEGFESALNVCRKQMNAENHGDVNYIANETSFSDLAVALRQSDWNKITPSSAIREPVLNFFSNVWGYIKNANTVISRINDIEWKDETVKNRILAEALWYRAYWYYRLVNTYGDVPWIGKELTEPKLNFYSVKSSVILNKLQEDLEFAVNWAPVTAKPSHVTKGAVNMLLGKIYLENTEFDKAVTAFSSVIDGPYSLMKKRFGINSSVGYYNYMWDLHRVENKNLPENTETIFATVDRPEAPSNTWYDPIGTYALRNYAPSYWKVLDRTGQRATNWDTPSGDTLGIGNADVRTNAFFHYWIWNDRLYTWDNTPDLRRSKSNWIEMGDSIASIITVRSGSPDFGEPLSKKYYSNLNDTIDTWYPYPRYKLYVKTTNDHRPYGGQGDWYIFRLAETYLLRAEAYYWQGKLSLAADDINKVRDRAMAPSITSTDVTIDYIFDERARELYTEEPRHTEMVRVSFIFARLNKDGYSMTNITEKNWYYDRVMRDNPFFSPPVYQFWGNTATIHPYNFLWPIPESSITANTLGRINQNIGYAGAEKNVPPLDKLPE